MLATNYGVLEHLYFTYNYFNLCDIHFIAFYIPFANVFKHLMSVLVTNFINFVDIQGLVPREDMARYDNNGTSRNGGMSAGNTSFYNHHIGANGHNNGNNNGHNGIMAVNNTNPNTEQGTAINNNASPPGT